MAGDEGFDLVAPANSRLTTTQLPWSLGFGRLSATGARVRIPTQNSKRAPTKADALLLAGDEGFEPPMTGPEPVALPLGQSPLTEQLYLESALISSSNSLISQRAENTASAIRSATGSLLVARCLIRMLGGMMGRRLRSSRR